MVDPADGAKITVPVCMLASKDEPADAVEKFKGLLKVPSHIETFSDQIHGWMAARYVDIALSLPVGILSTKQFYLEGFWMFHILIRVFVT